MEVSLSDICIYAYTGYPALSALYDNGIFLRLFWSENSNTKMSRLLLNEKHLKLINQVAPNSYIQTWYST